MEAYVARSGDRGVRAVLPLNEAAYLAWRLGCASLAAETGVAVFKVAFARWVSAPGQPDLPGIFRESLAELRGVLA